ncbi:hypothetical protein F5X68DRAFT_264751 [Plectosphaerella plurivora]|uniref:Rhodopsin domain-containing protein n=1 Tax=Plectosphaerella plurivora TaxID=936078 RepID=A0A9P8V5K6_9PEZI|nr:hypothetical protein F5X68DRAFT_264751 [Plectosphaerella plurivora]
MFLGQYGKHGDFLYDSSDLTIWTTVEICTAILAACIPCLKPLFRNLLAGSSAERYGSNPKYKSSGYQRSGSGKRSQHARGEIGNIELHGRPRHSAAGHGGDLSRTGSEESIINPKGYTVDGITKTTQVSVTLDHYN